MTLSYFIYTFIFLLCLYYQYFSYVNLLSNISTPYYAIRVHRQVFTGKYNDVVVKNGYLFIFALKCNIVISAILHYFSNCH
jgi:hypothetical protein